MLLESAIWMQFTTKLYYGIGQGVLDQKLLQPNISNIKDKLVYYTYLQIRPLISEKVTEARWFNGPEQILANQGHNSTIIEETSSTRLSLKPS